jgi:hypothetical protein
LSFISANIFFFDRGSSDQISLDQNCLFSVDQKFHFQLIEFFETFQLIETFINDLINCQKRTYGFWQLLQSSNNGILKSFDQVPKFASYVLALDRNFLS